MGAARPKGYTFRAEVWPWEASGDGGGSTGTWWFLSIPEELADDIEERHGQHAGGFGSVKVEVRIGRTTWSTSLFPDAKRGTYVLPVKKAVRAAEGLGPGVAAEVHLRVLVP